MRQTIVAGTECELERPDGSRQRIRGSRQGTPGDGLRGTWLLIGGSAAIVLGTPAALRWRAGTLEPA